jgi:hypothetical protein
LGGKPGDNARGDFLGGARSPRPRGEAGRKPRRVMIAGGKRRTEGPGETCLGEADSVPAGVRSPPLRGGASLGRMALRGKAGDNAKGDFLGGMRSARPRGTVMRMPRHCVPAGCVDDEPVANRRQRWGWPYGDVLGVRSPPLRGVGKPSWDGLAGKNRRRRERWFSRRDAVSAPGLQGRADAETFHFHHMR